MYSAENDPKLSWIRSFKTTRRLFGIGGWTGNKMSLLVEIPFFVSTVSLSPSLLLLSLAETERQAADGSTLSSCSRSSSCGGVIPDVIE